MNPGRFSFSASFQPRTLAFWVFTVFVLLGFWMVGRTVLTSERIAPVATVLGLASWLIFLLPMLWFFRKLGVLGAQSPGALTLAFLWGGFGAVGLALSANQAVISLLAKLGGPEFAAHWAPAIAGPSDEEPLKLIGVILLVLLAGDRIRSVAGVMALGALAGLGFQVVENLTYTINGTFNSPTTNPVEPVVQMFFVRGLLCGAWSHSAYTAIAAYGVGWFVVHREAAFGRRLGVAAGAVFFAWLMHGLWNSQLFADVFPAPWGVLAYMLFKGIPTLLASLLLWREARRERAAASAPSLSPT